MIQKNIAKLLSGIFNPLLMATYGILILFNSESYYAILPFEAKKMIFLTIIISTCLLPLAFLPLFIYQKFIQNVSMTSRKERIIPFSVIFIMYVLSYFLLKRMGVPDMVNNVILAGAATILVVTLITTRWKVSAHMAAIGVLTGALFTFNMELQVSFMPYILMTLGVAGLVGTSRIILKAHAPAQVYVGFGIGLAVMFLTYFIL